MFTITKEFNFSASHQLTHLPPGHKCARLHGHNYVVKIELEAEQVNSDHFVVDYGELSPLKDYLDNSLDHRHLNDVLSFVPTAENLAAHLYFWCQERWPQVAAIHVSETPKTWATFRK